MGEDLIVDVSDHDVLCGRGGATNRHKGNVEFRTTLAGVKDEYLTSTKSGKRRIAIRIVDAIHGQNGRFLQQKKESGVWMEIGEDKAITKTIQALREIIDRERRNKERKRNVEEGNHGVVCAITDKPSKTERKKKMKMDKRASVVSDTASSADTSGTLSSDVDKLVMGQLLDFHGFLGHSSAEINECDDLTDVFDDEDNLDESFPQEPLLTAAAAGVTFCQPPAIPVYEKPRQQLSRKVSLESSSDQPSAFPSVSVQYDRVWSEDLIRLEQV